MQSGGALNSAVDGMSFAHDIVMCTEPLVSTTTVAISSKTTHSSTSVSIGTTVTSTATGKPAVTPIAKPPILKNASAPAPDSGAINSMLSQIHGNGSNSLPGLGSLTPQMSQPNDAQQKDYKDPLRELVLISEAICINDKDTTYLSNVKTLAKEATVLEHIKEVLPEQAGQMPLSPAPLGGQQAAANVPEMATTLNMFQDPKDLVDPVKEREFLKKLEALDEADSEGFDGNLHSVQPKKFGL